MSVKRSLMRPYDDVSKDRKNWPKGAVEIRKNPDRQSRVPYIFYNEDGEPMCSAKRSDWEPDNPLYCGTLMTMDNGRCKQHGGVTGPTGVAHPRFKEGRYSKSLPSKLAARYQEAQDDPDLMSLREEVRLIDSKLADLLMNSDEGGAIEIFKEIVKHWKSYRRAEADGEVQKMTDAGRNLDDAIEEAAKEHNVWVQINKLLDMRRKMVLAEGKRLQMLDQWITVEQANVMMARLLSIVDRVVTDRVAVGKIVTEFGIVTKAGTKELGSGPVIDVGDERDE